MESEFPAFHVWANFRESGEDEFSEFDISLWSDEREEI
jgi:hypothetical protein